ncbi:MAG TPA: hypothetical protein QGF60_00280 [Candidatus Paceibacterota bacterium]|nr:hypothetical protein [Candidatus Paceibacterota bacterium]
MIKKSFLILLILAVFVPLSAFGATIKVGETYTFKSGDSIRDNLYIGAGEASSDGDVFGDLLIGAGSITVSGNVFGDATILGGDVSVLEIIQGDLRIVGGDVLVSENVLGDLVVVGGNVRILSDATIGNDLVVLGGRVVIQGDVNGKVRVIGGEVILDSKVSGNVDIKAGEEIVINNNAVISGDLIYSGKSEDVLNVGEGATILGETIFNKGKVTSAGSAKFALLAFFGVFVLIKLLTILVVVVLATIFLKKFSNAVAANAVEHLGKKTLWGFVTLIVIPAATIVFFASVFGIGLGILSTLGYLMLVSLASIYSGVIFGAWMDMLIRKKDKLNVNWKNGLLGVIALMFIIQVPVVGGLAGLFFFLLALGSISTLTYDYLWAKRK